MYVSEMHYQTAGVTYKYTAGGGTITLILYLSPVQWHWRLSFPPQLIHCQQISNVVFEKLGNIKKIQHKKH